MSTPAEDLLRQHGLHVTAQRLAVLKAVSEHPHIAADQIIDEARGHIGTISRQAVYDALGLLVEKGLVRRIQPIGSPALYEDRVNDNHHHLICRGARAWSTWTVRWATRHVSRRQTTWDTRSTKQKSHIGDGARSARRRRSAFPDQTTNQNKPQTETHKETQR